MVGDDPNSKDSPGSKPSALPPRPAQVENSPPPPPIAIGEHRSDAARDLFDTFQELRKKTTLSHQVSEETGASFWNNIKIYFGPDHLWKWLAGSLAVVTAFTLMFRHQEPPQQGSATPENPRSPASAINKKPNTRSLASQLRKYETTPPKLSTITAPPVEIPVQAADPTQNQAQAADVPLPPDPVPATEPPAEAENAAPQLEQPQDGQPQDN